MHILPKLFAFKIFNSRVDNVQTVQWRVKLLKLNWNRTKTSQENISLVNLYVGWKYGLFHDCGFNNDDTSNRLSSFLTNYWLVGSMWLLSNL